VKERIQFLIRLNEKEKRLLDECKLKLEECKSKFGPKIKPDLPVQIDNEAASTVLMPVG
jgi:hypothetical protein